ncbi:MAG: hypothetical protein F6K22_32565 [Okeania sp. SIO2F4]|uniref:hypothetical protein n=1 Tax=Microcoleaceae TaxID=1892252 RepID=UPI0014294233|nr:hypothetical protein [Okeania sp. SIO2F4]MDJ0516931.1 hypothetical protein [Trichodesmium sp. MO_231.B1]NES07120.1 hypothetical protein [Okeania sp. SIO2F4]
MRLERSGRKQSHGFREIASYRRCGRVFKRILYEWVLHVLSKARFGVGSGTEAIGEKD